MTAKFDAAERAAFNAGVEVVRQMAMVSAITLETRTDAGRVKYQAAVAALQAFADSARDLLLTADDTEEHLQA